MKVFLAGSSSRKELDFSESKYLLESFYSFKPWQEPMLKTCDMFLLDSGAFTFMNGTKGANFDEYLERYIAFINKYDVKYFFELDIDCIVGYEKVKEMRKRLELGTGKKCIPVWHKSRGKEEFLKMCDEYDYVAIGGIVTKEITKEEYKYFNWFINEAHKRNCKIHGLGFTSIKDLKKYHFDSVDSTSWLSGCRYGQLYMFDNGKITTVIQEDKRAIYKAVDRHNLKEWIKFQKYADIKL